MGLNFKKKEPVLQAVRRIGRSQLERALKEIDQRDRPEALHEVRKSIKRARAFLRLFRGSLRRTDYRRCAKELRKAARLLGAARDADVKLNALVCLHNRFKQELPLTEFGRLREVLRRKRREQQQALADGESIAQVRRCLTTTCRHVSSARLKESGWAAIAPGLEQTYRTGRRAFGKAKHERTADCFHECRKRVKDLYYQIGLLKRMRPKPLTRVGEELDRLGEHLGDDHDLLLLSEPGLVRQARFTPKQATKLLQLISRRQRELRAKAMGLAADFYGDKPAVFCETLHGYWKEWRNKSKPGAHH
jgi:CHAD domain-containing protein